MHRKRRHSDSGRWRQPDQKKPPRNLWDRIFRAQCKLFGCSASNGHTCDRCSADLYCPDFVQLSPFDPLAAAVSKFCRIFAAQNFRCDTCGKRLTFPRFYSEARVRGLLSTKFCTDKCFDEWLPF
jgi:hypothetical protein